MSRSFGGQVGDVAAVDLDRAVADRLQSGDDPQQRGLAAARRPHQHQELAIADGEIDVLQHLHGAEGLCDVVDRDRCHA